MIKGFIYSDQESLFGHGDCVGFGNRDFMVKEIPKETSKGLMIANHYSHKVCNDATTRNHLGVFINGEMLGVLQFGYAMNPLSMDKVVSGTALNEYKELNRMWLDDKAPRNSESRAISYCIKYLKKKNPKLKWIQSFADERCNLLGVVYQAANFVFVGSHESVFWLFEDEVFHNSIVTNNNRGKKAELEARGFPEGATKETLRQFRYIYFIKQNERKNLLLPILPYPKHGVILN